MLVQVRACVFKAVAADGCAGRAASLVLPSKLEGILPVRVFMYMYVCVYVFVYMCMSVCVWCMCVCVGVYVCCVNMVFVCLCVCALCVFSCQQTETRILKIAHTDFRSKATLELFQSEEVYAENLRVLCEVWMQPVRARALLRDDELALIFSNIEVNELYSA